MKFVHLHNHSDYSILDGAITIDTLIAKAVQFNMPAVALTDHGNMFGAIEFYQKAREKGIKPIIGQEFYVARGSRFSKETKSYGKDSSYHLVLLAKNEEGYKNLIRLSSLAYLEGFYYKPRIDMEILEKHSRGIFALSACLGGEIPALILENKYEEAKKRAGVYAEIFGKENFYLELQDNNINEQKEINRKLVSIGKELNLPLVATNDCHYPEEKDARAHEILLCIQTGKLLSDIGRMRFPSTKFYFRAPEEMEKLFAEVPDAIFNTYKIAEMVDLEIKLGDPILPQFNVPEGFTLDSYLRHLVEKNARKIFGEPLPSDVAQRIEFELSVISRMKFSGYFLIVWDFINFAKTHNIPVGPGRGSAAGSMVSYCLGITDLNPLTYNLLFERFLNPDRNEMPDMDIDFCANRRDEVIEYVKKKYGEDHVCQIITFNKLKAKAVIKDVARVLNYSFEESNEISKKIISDNLKEELSFSIELQNIYKGSKRGKDLIDLALNLEGHVRSAGKHAAGIVISRHPIIEYAPLYRDPKDGSISTQYEKESLQKVGLVKMDFLGLKNLTIIDNCIKLIEKNRGIRINIKEIPLDDEKTFKLLQRGDTNGVFQLESPGMQNILRKLGPTCIDDIIAVNALYRPGPLKSGMVDDFIKRKRNPALVSYPHPSLEPILKDTLGVIVYQEQVMLISQVLAGFSLSEADRLRKAMGKKIMEIIDEMEEKFIKGAIERNIPKKTAEQIYAAIRRFGEYGFNKSHSAAYAIISYQTAYLKAHYPVEYLCALLSAVADNQDDVARYVNDSRNCNVRVLPPDINKSDINFIPEGDAIRFGLNAIKGLGEKAIETILSARTRCGYFRSMKDFLEAIDLTAINKSALESLIKAGAFDSLHRNRAQLLLNVEMLIEIAKRLKRDKMTGQGNLFDIFGSAGSEKIELPYVRDWHDNEKLQREKEVLGVYLTGHPLAKYEFEMQAFACTKISDLDCNQHANEATVSIVGVISNLKTKTSLNGNRFAIAMIEDMSGSIEAVFMPNIFAKYELNIKPDEPLLFRGKIEFDDETPKRIIVNEVKSLNDIRTDSISAIHIKIDPGRMNAATLEALKEIVEKNSGDCPVLFHVKNNKDIATVIRAHRTYNVMPTDTFLKELTNIVGRDAVRITIKGC
ncbi:MAG: DNA polymerase III subunit alpha [Spirochaetes bacterium]|nr:DNA polymerase III subunit alpha [Spirochaetota bacterium]